MLYKYLSCYTSRYNLQATDLQGSAADELKLPGFDAEHHLDTRSLFCSPPVEGSSPAPCTALQTMRFQCRDLAALSLQRERTSSRICLGTS